MQEMARWIMQVGIKNATEEESRLLSIEVAAEWLSVSPWTIRKWLSDGRIKSCKLGSRRLIPIAEIKRFVNEAMTA
jgi:excisionase family DNA binding protein